VTSIVAGGMFLFSVKNLGTGCSMKMRIKMEMPWLTWT
jgi:hypothetical protein